MWSMPPPDLQTAAAAHDVDEVMHASSLAETLAAILAEHPTALAHTLPRDSTLFPSVPPEIVSVVLQHQQSNAPSAGITDAFLLKAVHRARLIKTPEEIQLIRTANAISSRAHELVMRVLGLGVERYKSEAGRLTENNGRVRLPGEWLIEREAEAEALFVASCRREGWVKQVFADSTLVRLLHPLCSQIQTPSLSPSRSWRHTCIDAALLLQ
jgi:Xaa-Pro dipeptidase